VKPSNARTFADVLTAARSGESWAYDRLHRQLARSITGFVTVRGAEDPEAMTNEVFLKAFRALDSFDGEEPDFGSWVFSIARNALIDGHRRSARRPQLASRADIDIEVSPSAEAEAMDVLSMERVTSMLASLSDDQREVITLRLVADLSLAQVAEIVGKPVTAVKALQRRGINRLQKEIGEPGVS